MTPSDLSALQGNTIGGIGTDILYVHRIERVLSRFGDRFIQRILGREEQQKYHARAARDPKRGVLFLATRFAAKEAFSKAIGLGMHMPMYWAGMQVLNAPSGKPIVVLSEPLKSWYEERFGMAHVSLTDESDMVMAFVIVEKKPLAKT
ncbi:holo-ACP synthase [Pelistega sp. NLN82]|uniref:Holo-[acyl-carrier-protein] synthase n=1 Tax=Pelistega ratti TaxID=2652177 RepID=A0A6L9Y4V6_9BURK|nr:holo-ACP synthase [Pelistega ratti]NEN75500.1 holo-ACP synthase [Pelistega ratti]